MKTNETSSEMAAIDLGSNSFHMIVARLQDNQLQILDRIKEPVRLASGLNDDNRLDDKVAQRALECLQRFGQRVRDIAPENLRAVGTNTLRKAHSCGGFLDQAQTALNHSIEIISGIEEARLIYLGAAHSLPDSGGQRLVVDIGGGSTELIIGEAFDPIELESLYVGCVGLSQRFFADGNITKESMRSAMLAARLELQPVKRLFRKLGWTLATGSSGTIRAIRDVVTHAGWSDNGISAEALKKLRTEMIRLGHTDALKLEGLSENRRPVFPGGVAILSAVFDALKLDRMLHSTGAVREGVIYDLVGRLHHQDIRETTVLALAKRYQVDLQQAQQVEKSALDLLDQVAKAWQMDVDEARQWLHWASYLHEIGLVIAHSRYHKHGAYLIENSDLPGFSVRDQNFLATLILAHRRKLKPVTLEMLPASMRAVGLRLMIILRLSVILNRGRSDETLPTIKISASDDKISLLFPEQWLAINRLTDSSLETEIKILKNMGIKLRYS
ncbi:MAG: exopolyphosphatase [Gammaproteobacteria bacterium]